MTSTYKALESVRSSLTRSRQLLEFPVRRFWAVWASRQLLDRLTRLLEEGKEELQQCSAAIVDVYKIETDDGVSH